MSETKRIAPEIHGYTYGAPDAAKSAISPADLERLKETAGFTAEDERWLRVAGNVLADQTQALVAKWRGQIGLKPHLSRHSKDPDGQSIPRYSQQSGLRLQQWVLDTCFRPYDRDWLNYQQEIALRHTSVKKNKTDGVQSTSFIPLRDVIAFTACMNATIRPFLAAKGNPTEEVEKMHSAWCKSIQLQIALWAQPYSSSNIAPNEW